MPRVALLLAFAVFGLLFGIWQVALPDLTLALELDEARLGPALSVGFLAAFPAMWLAGRAVDSRGATPVMIVAAAAMSAAFLALATVPSYVELVAILLVFYAGSGAYDIAINAAALGLERDSMPRSARARVIDCCTSARSPGPRRGWFPRALATVTLPSRWRCCVNAIRAIATAFGAVYVIVGLAGFIPPLVTGSAPPDMPSADGNLLGIFPINALHNLVHIVIGAALLYGATATPRAIQVARVVGVVYAAVALLGLVAPDTFGLMPIGGADILLHLVTAAVLLYIGFVADRGDTEASTAGLRAR